MHFIFKKFTFRNFFTYIVVGGEINGTFLLTIFGISVVYLAVTLIATALASKTVTYSGTCSALSILLFGILGTILFAIILLGIEFATTSIIGAIIVGILFFFFSLTLTTTACLARRLINCND